MEIIFDFDGTLADTERAVVSLLNKIGPEYGLPKVTGKEVGLYHEIGLMEMKKLFKISWWTFLRAGLRGQKMLKDEADKIEIYPGIREMCEELKKNNITLGIVSADIKENIVAFLEREKLMDFFEYIESCGLIGSKANSIKKMMRKRKLKKAEVFYVGDEIKDITASKKAGVMAIAVEWGYNKATTLEKYLPDFMVKSPKEIVDLTKNR